MPTTGASEVVASVGCLRRQGSEDGKVFEGEETSNTVHSSCGEKMEPNSTRVKFRKRKEINMMLL